MGRPFLNYIYETMPSVFAAQKLNFQCDAKQKEFLDCTAPDMILNWCRQSGKTTNAAIKVVHGAKYHNNFLALIISATQRQAGILQQRAKMYMYRTIQTPKERLVRTIMLPSDPMDQNSRLVRCSVLSFELANGSEVVSVPASPDTVRGYSPDLIVLDEASRIPDDTIDAIRPMRAAKNTQLIAMSTPAGRRGFFYREWTSDDPVWWKSSMTADECPRISQDFLAREKTKMSNDAMFRQEYYLEFIELTGGIFDPSHIRQMFDMDEDVEESVKPWLRDFGVEGDAYR